MREVRFACTLALIVAALGLSGMSTFGAESFGTSDDLAFRLGAGIYGVPVSSGDLTLEGAFGLYDVSVSAWAELQVIPMSLSGFGGHLSLTKDWLSLRVSASRIADDTELTLTGSAAPPAWLLFEGDFTLLIGTTASASTYVGFGIPDSEITVSPYLAGVVSLGGMVIKPSAGLELSLGPQSPLPSISGVRVSSTVDAGSFGISNTVYFRGLFDDFASVVVSIYMPDCGLTVSGSIITTAIGELLYRVGIRYEWGNASLLPILAGEPGTICTNYVCF